jgi:peptidoglycan/LPS O-acetylase OafA/YrhL
MIMGFAKRICLMSQSHRQPLIDMMKVVAAQFIFFHHAALYGPLAQAWHSETPVVATWMADYGLMAVQVFLVVAGYLAAQTLSRQSTLHPLLFISRRFERLVRPLWFVLLLTLVLTSVARPWLVGDMLPDAPGWGQLLAHVFLLQGALGLDSLSAGVWYTAVDFQLYVIMVWLVLIARKTRRPWLWSAMTAALTVISALWLNRHPEWDASGFYFFGAYGLGAMVFWARGHAWGRQLYACVLAGVLIALWVDWRTRLFVATITSCFLFLGAGWQGLGKRGDSTLGRLNETTYLFFLLNFPVLILANLIWLALVSLSAPGVGWVLVATWASGLLMADFLQSRLKWLSVISWIKKY